MAKIKRTQKGQTTIYKTLLWKHEPH